MIQNRTTTILRSQFIQNSESLTSSGTKLSVARILAKKDFECA